MRFSIFTPTYNRAHLLTRLFKSLKTQNFQDFEWIIVDDGSLDNTEEIVQNFQRETLFFSIIYKKTQNGGKHRAINIGTKLAQGELFYIVDSDDFLPTDALKTINAVEESIDATMKQNFAGVCGLRGCMTGEDIGQTFSGEYLDITSLDRERYNIGGDKAEVFYTKILKEYPFPEFEGENFATECLVWDKIASDGFKLRFFNQVVYWCEYQSDGLTAHYEKLKKNNPKSYGLYIYQSIRFKKLRGKLKWYAYDEYIALHEKDIPFKELAQNLKRNAFLFRIQLYGYRGCRKIFKLLRKRNGK